MELINELGTQLIKSFAEGLIALSGAGLLYLIAIARKKILAETEKIKNEDQRNLVKATIEKVDNLAKITVQNAEQVMVKEAKSTTEDGKLTKEDANKVKNAVKNEIIDKLSSDTKAILSEEYKDIESYIDKLIEAKVHELTNLQ